MILVAKPSKPFTYTAKNTTRRQAIINDYEEEINQLYKDFDDGSQSHVEPPPSWELPHALEFVRFIVSLPLGDERCINLEDDTDLFDIGLTRCVSVNLRMDCHLFGLCGCSVETVWMRSTLLDALRRSSKVDTKVVPQNIIYERRTIFELASYLSELVSSDPGWVPSLSPEGLIEKKAREMESLLKRFSSSFPEHMPIPGFPRPEGSVVLVTGSTGGLGCPLLAKLIEDPKVEAVYALNRKGAVDLFSRQATAFKERALDVSLLTSPKLCLIEADLMASDLGLPSMVYEEVRPSLKCFRFLTRVVS